MTKFFSYLTIVILMLVIGSQKVHAGWLFGDVHKTVHHHYYSAPAAATYTTTRIYSSGPPMTVYTGVASGTVLKQKTKVRKRVTITKTKTAN